MRIHQHKWPDLNKFLWSLDRAEASSHLFLWLA